MVNQHPKYCSPIQTSVHCPAYNCAGILQRIAMAFSLDDTWCSTKGVIEIETQTRKAVFFGGVNKFEISTRPIWSPLQTKLNYWFWYLWSTGFIQNFWQLLWTCNWPSSSAFDHFSAATWPPCLATSYCTWPTHCASRLAADCTQINANCRNKGNGNIRKGSGNYKVIKALTQRNTLPRSRLMF